ncbi:hypothetical protein ACTJKW_03190 [Serratia marcescens]|uniref:hypothetical protein n=1 Tax=Serratia marcescens TaxID=615 RepID=UPI0013D9ADB2|nr:hypothetical protein [Serratia marcescens]MBH3213483.1 hypothetical protein [Serratia marcescens]
MSNNPFSNVVKNSLVRVDNVAKAGSDLENYLVKASEALNDALSGPNEIFLTSDQDKTTAGLSGIINFIESANGVNRDTDKYIYICNSLRGEMIAKWKINKEATEMKITLGKIVNIYPVNDDGYISAISDILDHGDIMTKAVKLKNNMSE